MDINGHHIAGIAEHGEPLVHVDQRKERQEWKGQSLNCVETC